MASSQLNYSELPLSGREIRVLRILSTPKEPILRCWLDVVKLGDCSRAEYDCLSYTWNDPLYRRFSHSSPDKGEKPHVKIECNNQAFTVHWNLYDVLKELCRKKYDSPDGSKYGYVREDRIWIDAVCINQENMEERRDQVNMMSDIYDKARNVVVWLGPDDPPKLNFGLMILRRLASIPREKQKQDLPQSLSSPLLYEKLGIEAIAPYEWDFFAAFVLRSWFSRIWVIQETWAAQKIVVFCGEKVINWKDITAALQVLMATGLDEALNEHVERTVGGLGTKSRYVGNVIGNQFIFKDIIANKSKLTLERLLVYSSYFNATNFEDKVFAVRGMWEPSLNLFQGDATKLVPFKKPHQSLEHIYSNATLVSMREMGDINLLSFVQHLGDGPIPLVESVTYPIKPGDLSSQVTRELPTWVPNYTTAPRLTTLNDVPRVNGEKSRWKACGHLKWNWKEEDYSSDTWTSLKVEGYCIDTIDGFAATRFEIEEEHRIWELLQLLQTALDSTPARPSGEQFWRALINDTFQGKPATDDARWASYLLILDPLRELHMALQEARDEDVRRGSISLTTSNLEATLTKTNKLITNISAREGCSMILNLEENQKIIDMCINLPPDALPADLLTNWHRIGNSFRAAYNGRRLFHTKGNYLGIAIESIVEGDEIWVLAGLAVPMVFRRSEGDSYQLVGEAYIHGMMEGEMVDGDGEDFNLTKISLV